MKRMHRGVLIVSALLLPSCSSMRSETASAPAAAAPAVAPTPIVSGTIGETAVTATATVKKIDLKKRLVTLQGADGETTTITAGPEVKNLDQVRVGDEVVATYFESVAYEVKAPSQGTPGVAVAEEVQRAKPGERPGAAGARVTTITATITGIDKKKGTVTLTGPDGDAVTVKARNPDNLEKIKKGDLVDITMTQAVAIAVEPKKK